MDKYDEQHQQGPCYQSAMIPDIHIYIFLAPYSSFLSISLIDKMGLLSSYNRPSPVSMFLIFYKRKRPLFKRSYSCYTMPSAQPDSLVCNDAESFAAVSVSADSSRSSRRNIYKTIILFCE
ncbi:hypothetical protein [Enterococcus sp. BWR-S5]|uniref:hypothetical protein n=1 Tax=Enterococcus sp. BWR-S5 TaxID=2787714 RepID=UPI0019213551